MLATKPAVFKENAMNYFQYISMSNTPPTKKRKLDDLEVKLVARLENCSFYNADLANLIHKLGNHINFNHLSINFLIQFLRRYNF